MLVCIVWANFARALPSRIRKISRTANVGVICVKNVCLFFLYGIWFAYISPSRAENFARAFTLRKSDKIGQTYIKLCEGETVVIPRQSHFLIIVKLRSDVAQWSAGLLNLQIYLVHRYSLRDMWMSHRRYFYRDLFFWKFRHLIRFFTTRARTKLFNWNSR